MPRSLKPAHTRLATGVALALVLLLAPTTWRFLAPALSPPLALAPALATRSLSLLPLLALPMLAALVLRRRFWCRHLCPVGLLSDACGKLNRRRVPISAQPVPARLFALAALAGALAGFPLFLWLDPLALFAGLFNLTHPSTPALSALGLPLLLLFSYALPGLWCGRLCPLGGAADLLALLKLRPTPTHPARRALLASTASALLAALSARAFAARARSLRPPGAVPEAAFQAACIRCGSCSRICPTSIIQTSLRPADPTGLCTPTLVFSNHNYCLQDCNLCGQVCPTAVIRPLPLKLKNESPIGLASIHLPRCYLTLEKECGVCIARCPRHALIDTFDYDSYRASITVRAPLCNGCGACVGICPPKVIRILPLASI